jgi:hypothetical protein
MTGVENGGSGVLPVHEIPLSVEVLPVVAHRDSTWIVLTQAIEALGLNAEAQLRRLRRQPWAQLDYARVRASDGKLRQAVVCSTATFLMFVATVETARVANPATRRALEVFQIESGEALEAYWTKGIAVNPRGRTPEQLAAIDAAADGVFGPVLSDVSSAYDAVQVLEGRLDMPEGWTKTRMEQALYRRVRRAWAEMAQAGLDAAYALRRGGSA